MAQRRSSGGAFEGGDGVSGDGAGAERGGESDSDPFTRSEERAFFAAPPMPDDRDFFEPRPRWHGPQAGLALLVLATGYWSAVAFLVGGQAAGPLDFADFESEPVFEEIAEPELRPIPGTIPWQWSGCATGRITGPCPLGLARGIPHSLLIEQDALRAVPGFLNSPGPRLYGRPGLGPHPRPLGGAYDTVPFDPFRTPRPD